MNFNKKRNLKVQFFLRGAETCTNPLQNLVIYCQLELDGLKRDTPFSTTIKVPLCYWWTHKGFKLSFGKWINDDYYLSDNLNRNLQQIERKLMDITDLMPLKYDYEEITYDLIKNHFDPKKGESKDLKDIKSEKRFFDVMEEMKDYKTRKKQLKKETLKTYITRKNNLTEYFKSIKKIDIKISEINRKVIDNFEFWMIETLNEEGEDRFCRNYRNKHITLIRQVLDFALDQQYIKFMPIGKLNLEYDQEKPPNYLLPFQRKRIEDCNISRLEKSKDVAVFLMNTGFSYIDYKNLKSEHLIGEGFKLQRHKTDVFCLPPLLPKAKQIIEKYGGIENLPKPHETDLNRDLKYLGEFCELTEQTIGFNLSTSDFRETFCSMLENELMFGERPLMAAMGHKNPKQLRSYSRMMPQRVLYELKKQQEQMKMLGMINL
jgi:integrase